MVFRNIPVSYYFPSISGKAHKSSKFSISRVFCKQRPGFRVVLAHGSHRGRSPGSFPILPGKSPGLADLKTLFWPPCPLGSRISPPYFSPFVVGVCVIADNLSITARTVPFVVTDCTLAAFSKHCTICTIWP